MQNSDISEVWYKCLACQTCFQHPNKLIDHREETECGSMYPEIFRQKKLERENQLEKAIARLRQKYEWAIKNLKVKSERGPVNNPPTLNDSPASAEEATNELNLNNLLHANPNNFFQVTIEEDSEMAEVEPVNISTFLVAEIHDTNVDKMPEESNITSQSDSNNSVFTPKIAKVEEDSEMADELEPFDVSKFLVAEINDPNFEDIPEESTVSLQPEPNNNAPRIAFKVLRKPVKQINSKLLISNNKAIKSVNNDLQSEPTHNCNLCNKRFHCGSKLKEHLVTDHNAKPYQCPECFKRFKNSNLLKKHIWIHADVKVFGCEKCGKCFKTPHSLYQHDKMHKRRMQQSCTSIDDLLSGPLIQIGDSAGKLVTNDILAEPATIKKHAEKLLAIVCAKCDITFGNINEFLNHTEQHSRSKKFKCTQCSICFEKEDEFKNHFIESHENMLNIPNSKPFQCGHCHKLFSKSFSLKKHDLIHNNIKPYKCLKCANCFSKLKFVDNHLRMVHGIKY